MRASSVGNRCEAWKLSSARTGSASPIRSTAHASRIRSGCASARRANGRQWSLGAARAATAAEGDGAAKRARAAADLAPVPPWLWDDGKGRADEDAASLQEVMRQQHVEEADLKFFGEEALKEAGIATAITRAKMLRRIEEHFR